LLNYVTRWNGKHHPKFTGKSSAGITSKNSFKANFWSNATNLRTSCCTDFTIRLNKTENNICESSYKKALGDSKFELHIFEIRWIVKYNAIRFSTSLVFRCYRYSRYQCWQRFFEVTMSKAAGSVWNFDRQRCHHDLHLSETSL
jgi:hypothetical protein